MDKRKIITWSIIILAIVGLFIGLAYLGGGNSGTTLGVEVTATDHTKGPDTAKATLVEYSDFQCPACAQYEPLVQEVLTAFPNDLRFVYRHFPLQAAHPKAMIAAQAAEAAGKQNKFWEMHDLLFVRQDEWVASTNVEKLFGDYAAGLGLNQEQFEKDLPESSIREKINADYVSATRFGVSGTPTFYLNGKRISPRSLDEFKTLIQAEISK